MPVTDRAKKRVARPQLWLIAFAGVIVPRRLRADWRQEWEAELRSREALLAEWDRLDWRNKLDLLRRSVGALRDALLLQPRRMEDEMFQDLRFGARMLLKHKAFTVAAMLTLGLGIGANAAIFTLANMLLFRPLSVRQPGRLLTASGGRSNGGLFAYSDFQDYQERSRSFDGLAAFLTDPVNLGWGRQNEMGVAEYVSDSFFIALGVNAERGRV